MITVEPLWMEMDIEEKFGILRRVMVLVLPSIGTACPHGLSMCVPSAYTQLYMSDNNFAQCAASYRLASWLVVLQ